MKKNLTLVLVFGFVVSMVPLFGQDYKNDQKIKWGGRTLRVQHVDVFKGKASNVSNIFDITYGEEHSEPYWANVKEVALFDNFCF